MDDVALRLENVYKTFKLYHDIRTGPILERVCFWKRAKYYREFPAVRSVSLTVNRGECVGVIGPNGAGKTTLLKMIAGLLPIDKGVIHVNGTVTALLALGVGVHPELTGRENVLYGGLLLGLKKAEVLKEMDSIIEFSEIGEFIDHPLRTYSSGMRARLLFSVSMSIKPDILIVDEALATGDARFLAKSQDRIREMCRSGATVLFVSHNLTQIEDLCSRSIVMAQGSISFDGESRHAIAHYRELVKRERNDMLAKWNADHRGGVESFGVGGVRVTDVFFRVNGERSQTVVIGKACELCVQYSAETELNDVGICVVLHSAKSGITYAFVPSAVSDVDVDNQVNRPFSIEQGEGEVVICFDPLTLGDGQYRADVTFFPALQKYSYDTCYCFHRDIVKFQATYDQPEYYERGSLTEVPVRSVKVRTHCRHICQH